MSDTEFARGASRWRGLLDLEPTQAITVACRGSGNPATLAWIAEALELDADATVLDIGAGLGGAAAWLTAHYGCRVVATDPVIDAARCAREVFDLPAVVASGAALPLRRDSVDAAMALGVLSVVDDPVALLAEARRVAGRLAILAYLSATDAVVRCGGSTFHPRTALLTALDRAGWTLEAGPSPATLGPPPAWNADDDETADEADPDEAEVIEAVEAGRIRPVVALATRAGA